MQKTIQWKLFLSRHANRRKPDQELTIYGTVASSYMGKRARDQGTKIPLDLRNVTELERTWHTDDLLWGPMPDGQRRMHSAFTDLTHKKHAHLRAATKAVHSPAELLKGKQRQDFLLLGYNLLLTMARQAKQFGVRYSQDGKLNQSFVGHKYYGDIVEYIGRLCNKGVPFSLPELMKGHPEIEPPATYLDYSEAVIIGGELPLQGHVPTIKWCTRLEIPAELKALKGHPEFA